MKKIVMFILFLSMLASCNFRSDRSTQIQKQSHALIGTWIRVGHSGVMSLSISHNGSYEMDMGRDGSVDVSGDYKLKGDTVIFIDKNGLTCPDKGSYKLHASDDYIAFDLIDDMCGGRIKSTMGFWVQSDFKKRMKDLDKEILGSNNAEQLLSRARMNMALGNSLMAKKDFINYMKIASPDDRVYVNYAGTCFPDNLEKAMDACSKAIEINPQAKNAYFLRGLANYMSGKEKEGCDDFGTAISLGFSVLKIAEHERCAEYWD